MKLFDEVMITDREFEKIDGTRVFFLREAAMRKPFEEDEEYPNVVNEVLIVYANKEIEPCIWFVKKEHLIKIKDSDVKLDEDKKYGSKLYKELEKERDYLRRLLENITRSK